MRSTHLVVALTLSGCTPAPPASPEPPAATRTPAPASTAPPAAPSTAAGLRLPPAKEKPASQDEDCRVLIRTINAAVKEAKSINMSKVEGMEAFSSVYDRLGEDLRGLSLSSSTISKARDQYVTLAREVALATHAFATGDRSAKARIDDAVKVEAELTQRINGLCSKRPEDASGAPK